MPGYSEGFQDPDVIRNKAIVEQLNKFNPAPFHDMSQLRPHNTGSFMKDFILNVLGTAGNALKVAGPKTSPITGGKSERMMVNPHDPKIKEFIDTGNPFLLKDGPRYVTRHEAGSAKDLSLREGMQPHIRKIDTPTPSNRNDPVPYDAGPAILEESLPNPPPGLLRSAKSQVHPERDLPFAMKYNPHFGDKRFHPQANMNFSPETIKELRIRVEKDLKPSYERELILRELKPLEKAGAPPPGDIGGQYLDQIKNAINAVILRQKK
jgi:hypothetical protein